MAKSTVTRRKPSPAVSIIDPETLRREAIKGFVEAIGEARKIATQVLHDDAPQIVFAVLQRMLPLEPPTWEAFAVALSDVRSFLSELTARDPVERRPRAITNAVFDVYDLLQAPWHREGVMRDLRDAANIAQQTFGYSIGTDPDTNAPLFEIFDLLFGAPPAAGPSS